MNLPVLMNSFLQYKVIYTYFSYSLHSVRKMSNKSIIGITDVIILLLNVGAPAFKCRQIALEKKATNMPNKLVHICPSTDQEITKIDPEISYYF